MKNVKTMVSLVMVVAIVASLGAVGFASNRFKTDVVTDWQYGMLNDLSNGTRTVEQHYSKETPALTVTPVSSQSARPVAVTISLVDADPLKEVAVDPLKEVVVTTTAPVRTTSTVNPYVNEWQQAILDDLSTGTRKVGQTAPITVYKDANTALNPGTTSYDYIAWN